MIDTHVHFWQPGRFQYSWLPETSPLHRDVLMSHLCEAAQGQSLQGGVLIEAANATNEIPWLIEQVEAADGCWGVIGWVDPDDPEAVEHLVRCTEFRPFRGIRINWLEERRPTSQWQPALAMLATHHWVIEVLTQPAHIPALADFIGQHPDLTFVIEHFGGGLLTADRLEAWTRAMSVPARWRNAHMKLSGFARADAAPVAADTLSAYINAADALFGVERLMFGSNFPISQETLSYDQVVTLARTATAERDPAWQAALFHETARCIYRLNP